MMENLWGITTVKEKKVVFFPLCYVDCVIGDFGRLLPSRYLCVFGGERRLGLS